MFDDQNAVKPAADQFRDAITEKGLIPPDTIIGDGKLRRFSSNGKPDDDAGWYVFHDGDIPAGAFGDFRTNQGLASWMADIGRPLSPVEKSDYRKKQEEIRLKREAETSERRAKAKIKAAGMLKSSQSAPNNHPYLQRKGVSSHGLHQWKNLLLVPMIDDSGEVQSLQMISPNGDKKFLTGGKMQSCYFTLGSLKNADMILIAEGYATAATIHEITGHPVVVAYNAGNLLAVSKSIRAQYPDLPLYLCADDDIKTQGNPGITKATEAALAVEGKVIAPYFGGNRPDGATDFNDMAAHLGKDAVTGFFTTRFSERMDDTPPPEPEDRLNGQEATFCRPNTPASTNYAERSEQASPAAAQHPASPPYRVRPAPEPVAEPNMHFSNDDMDALHEIWKAVPRRNSCHSESGYHLVVDEKRKVIITKTSIELAQKPRHRPDEAYAAACEHARHFWGGQMEVHGDLQHRVKAWAYAQAHNIQLTNYTPTGDELREAEKILNALRKEAQPAFRRPIPIRPQGGKRPSLRLDP